MKHLLQFLALAWASTAVAFATSTTDVDRTANAVALSLNGVILNCPTPFQTYGSPDRRCVSTDLDAVTVRKLLSSSPLKLYGAWRSINDTHYTYNWVSTTTGSVNILVVPDLSGRGKALVYLGTPPMATATTFQRVLRLGGTSTFRMHGSDVMALQNRLMDVSRIARGRGGDGWYGPVTEASVIAFQSTNGLSPTGVVDQATWDRLFSSAARYFNADLARAISERAQK